ncbi:Hsp70 family protein [Endomicrobium sp. AH-315-J14]|nr:Hsp70 family protein [Endomicrobium sp. AH-315-J14]
MSTKSKDGAIVGIDLGTTYSLVATLQAKTPTVLENAIGETLTPSVVSVDEDGSLLMGAAARARLVTHPKRTVGAFKRSMGTDKRYQLADRSLRPEELSAAMLSSLKRDAEEALNMPIVEAVVTVPAYFGELQRRATRDACEIAGLRVERIINEPTAAALAYGLHESERELRAVVLDLGGGTFDVTVLEIIEGVIEIQGSAGDVRLGGDDFAEVLARHCRKRIKKEHGSKVTGAKARARLFEACEAAKRHLSGSETARIALPKLRLADGPVDVELQLKRAKCDKLWAPLLDRIEQPIKRALRDAGVAAERIDEVLLVGGATRMPCVVDLATRIFSKLPLSVLPPDEAVAMGAAVQAALKRGDEAVEDLVVTDISPFTLGVATARSIGTESVGGIFSPVLERGTVLPASRIETFNTMADGQSQVLLEIYQGEHALCADNQKLGEYTIKGIPHGRAGEQSFEVRFTYDLNGILEVEATIVATKKKASLVIERAKGQLTRKQIKDARLAMKALKFHPRDALPNRTALARADALFVELTGINRSLLGEALGDFRAALETQDTAAIDSCRENLVALTSSLRSYS